MARVPLHKNNAIGIARDALGSRADRLGKDLAKAANADDPIAVRFVDHLRKGPSDRFLREIFELVKDVRDVRAPTYKTALREFHWVSFMQPPKLAGKEWAYALVVVRMVNAKLTNRFHQCLADDCDNYFFGDPRSRWCSKTCGSRQRVGEKRGNRKRRRPQ